MSTTTTTGPTTTATVEKPPRRFPPPCWTQDEALALIQAYRERWYALRRGYLRTADWDAVAEHLGRLFPGAVPPKTSAQCRHKMEKLRQRYRAEKQRALAFSGGRFLSTWFFFQAMDSMEKNGTGSGSNNNNNNNDDDDVIITGNDVNNSIINRQLNMNVDSVYGGLNPGRGIRFKPAAAAAAVAVDNNMVNVASRVRVSQNYDNNNNNNNDDEDEDDDDDEEFDDLYYSGKNHRLASQTNPRKYSKIGSNVNANVNANVKYNNYKRSYWNEDGESDDDDEDMSLGGRSGGRGNDDSIGQIVSSIKALADGFVKVERMKMEMVHEIERMRMEAEMKRNKMVLESQKQIVEAFVKGLSGNKRQHQ